ncbi:leucine-rich repeat protein soc-2 homolog [Anopheles gambiae]|nr:leucine-rich repeat protein soc-2 homolog [Anopheles gambiae]
MIRWIVWLWIVSNAVSSSNRKPSIFCTSECFVANFKSKEDSFVFQNISNLSNILTLQNVFIKHMDYSILEKLPSFIDILVIFNSKKLQWLDIPSALSMVKIQISSLRRIDIAANSSISFLTILGSNLTSVPITLQNAKKLKGITITHSKLSEIDLATFCDYSSLSELNLERNMIRYVVNTSTKKCRVYNTLTKLVLDRNMLTTVNMELFNVFSTLRGLVVQSNNITSLSGQLYHDTLETLSFDGNKLKHLDLCGWYVPSLNTLSIAANELSTVPECIHSWTRVTSLFLSQNKLTKFSIESVACMNNLTWLELQCNQLTEITLNSARFPAKLELIDIRTNNLTSLDISFIPAQALDVNVEYNLISRFDVNNTSQNVTSLRMLGNPVDCSWSSLLDRSYSGCNRSDASIRLRDHHVKLCNTDHLRKNLFY